MLKRSVAIGVRYYFQEGRTLKFDTVLKRHTVIRTHLVKGSKLSTSRSQLIPLTYPFLRKRPRSKHSQTAVNGAAHGPTEI